MKPRIKIASSITPDGGEMELYKHDNDFFIRVNGQELMNSRLYESELELARLGCAHLTDRKTPSVLIGGLGMGYTLRQTLEVLPSNASIVVSELLEAVVDWNREFLGGLNDLPLNDARVQVKTGDIVQLILMSENLFDTILLDVDNGPDAMTNSGNSFLYSFEGLHACRRALRKKGCLAIWSVEPSKPFENRLVQCGFHVRRYRVPAYKGSKTQSRFIFLASENLSVFPPGGGEPLGSVKKEVKKPKNFRSRRY